MREWIAGVDQSYSGTGVVMLCAERVGDGVLITDERHGLFKNEDTHLHYCERADLIAGEVVKWMHEVGEIVAVAMEGYAFGAKNMVAYLGELGATIKLSIRDADVRARVPAIIGPTQLKKFTTGKGACDKDLILLNVFKRWGFDTSNNNIADAYALARFILACSFYRKSDLLAYEAEALTSFGESGAHQFAYVNADLAEDLKLYRPTTAKKRSPRRANRS